MSRDNWIQALAELEAEGTPCIMVTVLEDKGSTPRDAGSKMVITQDEVIATIGGGHLEHIAIKTARDMLGNSHLPIRIEHYNLGANLGQCCGGHVTLCFEPVVQSRHIVALFGAGHVAKALIHILATLPLKIIWIDQREEQFPSSIPHNVETHCTDDPIGEVRNLPDECMYIVMTHSHQLDFDLSRTILKRPDRRYFGLIGSKNKRKRFDYQLKQAGFDDASIESMICPIGLHGIKGKLPAEIAVAIAGELIACYQGTVMT